LIELLRRVADEDPRRAAILTHERTVSYGELVGAAENAAAALRREGVTRFAVADHEAEPVVALMAAASAVGAEACLYPPAEPDEIGRLLERFDHDLVVTPRDDLAAARVVRPGEWTSGDEPAAYDGPAPDAPRPHLVQTTGTTGMPRGVRHDWGRLLRGTARIRPERGHRWLLAYGIHQFAGLQILLHVFAAGATLVAPAPRRPREGLRAMRELGVTHASATPTFWRFVLAEMRADGGPVPSLTQVTLGGEAIPGPLLGELERTFPDARISQVYAASEFGSTGSMRDQRAGLSAEVLHRGDDADVAMKIVDGELWVRSRTGMLGYYGEPPVDPDAWRPTGDLVEADGDRIHFLGRSSEIINVGGVKVHPLTIEERVSGVTGVGVARVFGRPNPMTGQIVALEVVADADADQGAVESAIRQACADLPSAARPRSIRFVDQVAMAGSKIVRRSTGEQ
jgi:acyl-CoA synthetase (AMP-forming)/AMP-acid ligase II